MVQPAVGPGAAGEAEQARLGAEDDGHLALSELCGLYVAAELRHCGLQELPTALRVGGQRLGHDGDGGGIDDDIDGGEVVDERRGLVGIDGVLDAP